MAFSWTAALAATAAALAAALVAAPWHDVGLRRLWQRPLDAEQVTVAGQEGSGGGSSGGSAQLRPFEFPTWIVPHAVPELRWETEDSEFAAKVADWGVPVLFRNASLVSAWPALRDYSAWPFRLRRPPAAGGGAPSESGSALWARLAAAPLLHVKTSLDPLFCPAKHAPGQVPSVTSRRDLYSLHNLSLAQLLAAAGVDVRTEVAAETPADPAASTGPAEGAADPAAATTAAAAAAAAAVPSALAEQWVYYAGTATPAVMADVAPAGAFHLHSPLDGGGGAGGDGPAAAATQDVGAEAAATARSTDGAESASVQTVWIAEDGVIANLHYDRSHNFVVQVTGTKEWSIFPSWQAPHLYIYPSLHPHYHTTQVDLLNEEALEHFPQAARARGFRVLARPGDVLYVPPFWAHTVKSAGQPVSVSSSVLSPSYEEMRCAQMRWVEPPFTSTWPFRARGHAALRWAHAVVRQYYARHPEALASGNIKAEADDATLLKFARRVLGTRYRLLLEHLLPFTSADMKLHLSETDLCEFRGVELNADSLAAVERAAQQVVDAASALRRHAAGRRAAAGVRFPALARAPAAEAWRGTRAVLEPGEADAGVAEVCLGNWLEHALSQALGAENLAAAVAFCCDAAVVASEAAAATAPAGGAAAGADR